MAEVKVSPQVVVTKDPPPLSPLIIPKVTSTRLHYWSLGLLPVFVSLVLFSPWIHSWLSDYYVAKDSNFTDWQAFVILMIMLFVVQIALPFFMIRFVPLEAGQQGYSSVFGYRLMERRLKLPIEPEWGVKQAPGFLWGLARPLGEFKIEYATGVITIDISPPEKDRSNPDPKVERPYLEYKPFTISHDRSTMTVRDPNFRFNTGNLLTSIPHLIEDDQEDVWEAEEERLKRPLTPEERKALEFSDEERERRKERYEREYPDNNPDNRTVAIDTQVSVQGLIFSTWQFDLIVGSYETLGKNITRLAQDVLTELIARYTLGMLKNRKPPIQRALRRKLENAILDPDCKEQEKHPELRWRSWGFNLLEIAITNWGVSYYFNLESMRAAAAGHYLVEQTTKGQADRAYQKETRLADVDVATEMAKNFDPQVAREETIRSVGGAFAHAVEKSGLKAVSIGNPGDLTHGIVAGVEALGGNITGGPTQPAKEDPTEKKPLNAQPNEQRKASTQKPSGQSTGKDNKSPGGRSGRQQRQPD